MCLLKFPRHRFLETLWSCKKTISALYQPAPPKPKALMLCRASLGWQPELSRHNIDREIQTMPPSMAAATHSLKSQCVKSKPKGFNYPTRRISLRKNNPHRPCPLCRCVRLWTHSSLIISSLQHAGRAVQHDRGPRRYNFTINFETFWRIEQFNTRSDECREPED